MSSSTSSTASATMEDLRNTIDIQSEHIATVLREKEDLISDIARYRARIAYLENAITQQNTRIVVRNCIIAANDANLFLDTQFPAVKTERSLLDPAEVASANNMQDYRNGLSHYMNKDKTEFYLGLHMIECFLTSEFPTPATYSKAGANFALAIKLLKAKHAYVMRVVRAEYDTRRSKFAAVTVHTAHAWIRRGVV